MSSLEQHKLCTFENEGDRCSLFLTKRDWEILHTSHNFMDGGQSFIDKITRLDELSYMQIAGSLTMLLNSTKGSQKLYGYDYSAKTKLSSGKRVSGVSILGMRAKFNASFAGLAFFTLYRNSATPSQYKAGIIDARSFAFSEKELLPDIKITAKEKPLYLFTELDKLMNFVKEHMKSQGPFRIIERNFEAEK